MISRSVKPGDNVAIRVNLSQDEIAKGFMVCKMNEPQAVAVGNSKSLLLSLSFSFSLSRL